MFVRLTQATLTKRFMPQTEFRQTSEQRQNLAFALELFFMEDYIYESWKAS